MEIPELRCKILEAIDKRPKENVSVKTIGLELGVDRNVVARELKALENQGLIRFVSGKKGHDGMKVFIGHGRSLLWRELKDFLADRLQLEWDEFNREIPVGITITDRLSKMLETSDFAFLVMTGEDERSDGTKHARENVVHELGLFQGKLGFQRAIILLEEGCEEFSNIGGLGQIRFPIGNILAKSDEIRRVLEREGLIPSLQ